MPRLVRRAARVAVVAGTATAVSGRVQRRQAARYGDGDAQAAPAPDPGQPAPAAADPAATEPSPDKYQQLKSLGDLKAQGVLTEEEFAAEKAKILSS